MELKMPTFAWKQVDGDMNPGTYGGTIAQADGQSIELITIQPTREYVGNDARDVGFPFWSKEAYFDLSDLNPNDKSVASALKSIDLSHAQLNEMDPETRALAIALALVGYGRGDEGHSGWAKDVIGDRRVQWYRSKGRQGWRYLADEDVEFRRFLREG